jgi:excisionase family DNA binding protein
MVLLRCWLIVITDDPMDIVPNNTSLPDDKDRGISTDPLWTVEELAAYLKLQPETIRSMARRGELPALKIGKVWRFQKHAIHEMLVNMY